MIRQAVVSVVALMAAAGMSPLQANTPTADVTVQDLVERLAALENQVALLEDREQINKLTRAFGYYGDKGLWDQVIGLFAENCRIEIAGRGIFFGRDGAERLFMGAVGRGQIGLPPGMLANHMVLQGIVDVASDGLTAQGRWRELGMVGRVGEFQTLAEGVLQVSYVKEKGVWKFSEMRWVPTFYTPWDQGWARQANPINEPSEEYPPDAPPSEFDIFPGQYVVPFHYPNPVTGEPWSQALTDRYSTKGLSPTREETTGEIEDPENTN